MLACKDSISHVPSSSNTGKQVGGTISFLIRWIVSVNVCTLRPGGLRVNNTKSKSRIQSGLTSRIKELDRQLSDAKVDVVCMQEGRLSLSAVIESNEFSIFRSAAYANGNCGVMVWNKWSLKEYYVAAN